LSTFVSLMNTNEYDNQFTNKLIAQDIKVPTFYTTLHNTNIANGNCNNIVCHYIFLEKIKYTMTQYLLSYVFL